MGSLHYDAGSIKLNSIHSSDGIISITLIIVLHKGITALQVHSIDLPILGESILNVPLTGTLRELANIYSSIARHIILLECR